MCFKASKNIAISILSYHIMFFNNPFIYKSKNSEDFLKPSEFNYNYSLNSL
jgi:hypothetical protein